MEGQKTEIIELFKQDNRPNQFCAYCGKLITKKGSNRTIYCSMNCARKAASHQRMDYIKKRSNSMTGLRVQVLSAYNSRCAICGWRASEDLYVVYNEKIKKAYFAYGCEIHHIIPVAEGGGNNGGNMILLCPNHHKQANMGLIKRLELLEYVKPLIREEEYLEMKEKCKEPPEPELTEEEKDRLEKKKQNFIRAAVMRYR